ncbi:MAG: glycoside hydrolase family 2 [Clostridia bacterium]|nr:glycoside hydrolase family 2 TIM barrel-domain containing protein [Lachnospiraceae bacterium]NCC00281.1 glycoside hydrolase family 2 [Clostridia bacterium]NCD02305.1 glycoside hydrolase family 2 [Clostridia bacterium]
MNIKDALRSVQLGQEHQPPKPLMTPWGETLDKKHVHEEYPRPQMVRNQWECLNGWWDYCFVSATDIHQSFPPKSWDGKILVPFSPESILSGVERQLKPGEYLWYHRRLKIEHIGKNQRCLLHFGAVDERCHGYVNGKCVGSHRGGYLPFEWDITAYLHEGMNELYLLVRDDSEYSEAGKGKQKCQRGGMFYTAQSGIWQTVWMEWVPENYIRGLKIIPDYDGDRIQVEIDCLREAGKYTAAVFDGNQCVALETGESSVITLHIPEKKVWSPEQPFLYDLEISADEDRVKSYFAMRIFTMEKDEQGILRTCLNHRFYFQNGVLDQGYWPDGLYTPPSDEALIFDIQSMKNLGFNMLRKHAKIESLRWYYHCDRLGMLVWQDMVNGGGTYSPVLLCYLPTGVARFRKMKKDHPSITGRRDIRAQRRWLEDSGKTVDLLFNSPSVACWVPFNEGWGQFDTEKVTQRIRMQDKSRWIDSASGWFDMGCGDFVSEHNYFRKLTVRHESDRAFVLSEYGGYACRIPEHSTVENVYGYRTYEDMDSFSDAFRELLDKELKPLIEEGLCAAVYTQLSDIEEEANGLWTYDRKVCKITVNTVKKRKK